MQTRVQRDDRHRTLGRGVGGFLHGAMGWRSTSQGLSLPLPAQSIGRACIRWLHATR